MATALKVGQLQPAKAPNLPIAPVEYIQSYQNELNNAFRLYFNQLDNVIIGLVGTPMVYTVSQLPTAGIKGRRLFVSDATSTTFAATVTGGGSNSVPVFDNGTAWLIG